MSQLVRQSNEKDVGANEQRGAVIKSRTNNIIQWSQGLTASTANITPGTTTNMNINMKSEYLEQEVAHYIKFTLANAHASADLILQNIYSVFDLVSVYCNDSEVKLEIKSIEQLREIYSEWLLNMGLNIYEESSFVRNEFNTFAGITIPFGTEKVLYWPIDPILSFAGVSLNKSIDKLYIEVRATPEQANVGTTCNYFKSSTAANAWTVATIQLKNIKYVRQYVKLNSLAQVQPLFNIPKDIPMQHVHWKVETFKLYTGTWVGGSTSITTKLSDIYRSNMIQHVSLAVRPVASAYNSAEAVKEYSGYNYIGWRTRTLNNGGTEFTVDMTDARLLRDYELKQLRNEYGRKQLPVEIVTDAANLMSKYYTRNTRLNFDFMQVEDKHEVVRFTNSTNADYNIEVFANTTVSGTCDLMAYVVIAQVLNWNKTTGKFETVNF